MIALQKLQFARIILTSFLFISVAGNSQNTSRRIINIPDIPGYKTLKCDLHMHTVFSDGTVWPTVRVEEAWAEGLDVIAITDHLGHHYRNNVDDDNFSRNYDIAKPLADKLGIILIKGTEITKSMPFGHFNALFVNDLKKIDIADGFAALREAANQGAFITWNHPGWKMPDNIPIWDSIHDALYKNGLFNGIEVVNQYYYSPLTFSWANDKNLTLISGSDIHDPSSVEFNNENGLHRPIDLVFAKDTSAEAIKEALVKHRTVIYYKNFLFGKEELLKALFTASTKIINPEFSIDADSKSNYYNYIQIQNNSCIDFDIELADADKILILTKKTTLKANSVTYLDIKPAPRDIKGDKNYILKYKVKNLLQSPENCITTEFSIRIKYL